MSIFFSFGIKEKGTDMIHILVMVAGNFFLLEYFFQVAGVRWKMIVEEDEVTVYPALFGKCKKI